MVTHLEREAVRPALPSKACTQQLSALLMGLGCSGDQAPAPFVDTVALVW